MKGLSPSVFSAVRPAVPCAGPRTLNLHLFIFSRLVSQKQNKGVFHLYDSIHTAQARREVHAHTRHSHDATVAVQDMTIP